MTPPRGKLVKRQFSPTRGGRSQSMEYRKKDELHMRGADEHRSKRTEEVRPHKDKAPARTPMPLVKKRKVVHLKSGSSSEDARRATAADDFDEVSQDFSSEYETPEAGGGNEEDSDQEEKLVPTLATRGRMEKEKKPVTVDHTGFPYGKMKTVLESDVKSYAKDLDPTTGWEAQPLSHRGLFFKRLYADWELRGPSNKINEKFILKLVTKVLITTRFNLNVLIDGKQPRPAEVTEEQWNTLVSNRGSPSSKKVSDHMRCISKGKGSKVLQMKEIEKEAIIRLSLELKRAPEDAEITEEVFKEFRRQEALKRSGPRERAEH